MELQDEVTKIFLNSTGNLEGLDPDIAAFLRYVDGHAAAGKFTKGIDAEVERLKKHEETRREYMKLNMLLNEMKAEGVEEGDRKAESRMSKLMKLLISKGKKEEALEASTNERLRKKLYAEYGI